MNSRPVISGFPVYIAPWQVAEIVELLVEGRINKAQAKGLLDYIWEGEKRNEGV
jgi:Asp-tRNA(Asn)/Glu-tRNA(Gln) amidotransferase B subunit